MSIKNSLILNFSRMGSLQINCTNHTPKRNRPPSQRLCVIIIITEEYGDGNGVGIIYLAGGKGLISFAIINGTSHNIPKIKPTQNKSQKYLLIFVFLYKR
jgi:hypothetical protein